MHSAGLYSGVGAVASPCVVGCQGMDCLESIGILRQYAELLRCVSRCS